LDPERMGGTLGVQNRTDGGTRVTLGIRGA
jgi:hypothetical protein